MIRKSALRIFIVCSLSFFAYAQNISILESRLESCQSLLSVYTRQYDSINTIYMQKIREIDNEKHANTVDKAKVEKMMAGTVGYGSILENLQMKIRRQQDDVSGVQEKLGAEYSRIIDSLQKSKKGLTGEALKAANETLMTFMTRNLLISPHLKMLSFDPRKLAEIDLAKITDPTQKKLYSDYLIAALNELTDMQSEAARTSDEIAQLLKLRKKMSRFLEDVDFSQAYSNTSRQTAYSGSDAVKAPLSNNTVEFDRNGLSVNVITFSTILGQLSYSLEPGSKEKLKRMNLASGRQVNLTEYQSLLKQLKQKLEEYRELIKGKLDNGK